VDQIPTPVAVLLKEYDTLRDEVVASIQTRATILSIGFGAQAALIAATGLGNAAGTPLEAKLMVLLTYFAIPGASIVIMALWLGEFARMSRAGAQLVDIEIRIDQLVGHPCRLLTWERNRWSSREVTSSPRSPNSLIDSVLTVQVTFASLLVLGPLAGYWLVPNGRALVGALVLWPLLAGWLGRRFSLIFQDVQTKARSALDADGGHGTQLAPTS
jgi:hypothetical protein